MKFLKKSACAVLAALLIAGTGCNSSDTSWVYEYNGSQTPAGVYLLNLISAASAAESQLVEENEGVEGYTAPEYKQLVSETIEGVTGSDWMLSDANRRMREYYAIEEKFAEMELDFTEEDRATIQASTDNVWSYYGEYYEQNGIAESSMTLLMQNTMKKDLLFQALYSEGGQYGVPESQLRDLLAADYSTAQYVLFSKTTVDTEEQTADDANAATKATAESYLQRATDGVSMTSLSMQWQKSQSAEPDSVTEPTEDAITMVIPRENGYYEEEIVNAAFASNIGEPVLVETEYYFYLMKRTDILEDPDIYDQYRDTILNDLKYEEYEELISQWAAEINAGVNQEAVDRYHPTKLKLDA